MDAKILHELFEYEDGVLYWKPKSSKSIRRVAGSLKKRQGYYHVGYNKKTYLVHRIIYAMHYGVFPNCVDHIDGNSLNNKISNLREATMAENQQNSKIRIDNTSGAKGVSWHKTSNRWSVRLQIKNERKSFGFYDDLELAKLVAEEARNKYHKQFARHQ